jgi:hypothetical protein
MSKSIFRVSLNYAVYSLIFSTVIGFTVQTPFKNINARIRNQPVIGNAQPSFLTLHNASDGSDAAGEGQEEGEIENGVEEEIQRLQEILDSIEAIEERNKAQLESFVDEQDQWDSMDDFEKELLESKEEVLEQMEKMAEELLQLWMGAKSMEG